MHKAPMLVPNTTHTKKVFSKQVDIEIKENGSNEKNQCSVRKYIKFHYNENKQRILDFSKLQVE